MKSLTIYLRSFWLFVLLVPATAGCGRDLQPTSVFLDVVLDPSVQDLSVEHLTVVWYDRVRGLRRLPRIPESGTLDRTRTPLASLVVEIPQSGFSDTPESLQRRVVVHGVIGQDTVVLWGAHAFKIIPGQWSNEVITLSTTKPADFDGDEVPDLYDACLGSDFEGCAAPVGMVTGRDAAAPIDSARALVDGGPDAATPVILDAASRDSVDAPLGPQMRDVAAPLDQTADRPLPVDQPPPPPPPTVAPADPADLQAKSSLPTTVQLSWKDLSTNESEFQIERQAPLRTKWARIATVPADTTTYDDNTVTAGSHYAYQVRASNVIGPSAYVGPALVTTAIPLTTETKFQGRLFGSEGIPTREIEKAFDGSNSSYYESTQALMSSCHLGMDLGGPVALTKLRFFPRSAPNNARMKDGRFEISNTSQTDGFTTLYTIAATPAVGNFTEATITGSARYVRYVGPATSLCNVAEIEIYGKGMP